MLKFVKLINYQLRPLAWQHLYLKIDKNEIKPTKINLLKFLKVIDSVITQNKMDNILKKYTVEQAKVKVIKRKK